MKTLTKSFFVTLIAFALCPRASAQTADCENAELACHKQCDIAQITDLFKMTPVQSDFASQCKHSCAAGLASCKVQNSQDACDTFFYHCTSDCPWTVNTHIDTPLENTNAFQNCGKSCWIGQESCKATPAQEPARERTGTFQGCTEAQFACYSGCMPGEIGGADWNNFPDLCAQACAGGVSECDKTSTAPSICNDFYFGCADACPDIDYDEEDVPYPISARGDKCLNACEYGAQFCEEILR